MSPTEELVPLHSMEAEMSALGCCLYTSRAAEEVVSALVETDFFRPAHRVIFRALTWLTEHKRPIDILTLKARLTEAGDLENIGGYEHLLRIVESVPTAANAAHYADIVKQNGVLRNLEETGRKIIQLCRDADLDTAAKITEAEKLTKAVQYRASAAPIPIQKIAMQLMDDVEPEGVPTGFKFLDRMTDCGGYPADQVTAVCGYSKAGKTTFSISSGKRIAERGGRVLFYTLADLSPKQITRKIVTMNTGIKRKPQGLDADEHEAWANALNDIYVGGWDFEYLEAHTHGRAIEDIVVAVRSACWERKRDVVFVDYAQEITTKREKMRDNPTQVLEHASRELAALARELKVPIVVGSQITDDGRGNVMTKYARGLEEAAGWVLRIHRKTQEEKESDRIDVETAFNRFGEEGVIKMGWDRARVMFGD